jgi:hypothetical protein
VGKRAYPSQLDAGPLPRFTYGVSTNASGSRLELDSRPDAQDGVVAGVKDPYRLHGGQAGARRRIGEIDGYATALALRPYLTTLRLPGEDRRADEVKW